MIMPISGAKHLPLCANIPWQIIWVQHGCSQLTDMLFCAVQLFCNLFFYWLDRLPYTASGRLCCYCCRFIRAMVTASFHLWDSGLGDRRDFSILFTYRLTFHVNGSHSFYCTDKQLCQHFMPCLSYHLT